MKNRWMKKSLALLLALVMCLSLLPASALAEGEAEEPLPEEPVETVGEAAPEETEALPEAPSEEVPEEPTDETPETPEEPSEEVSEGPEEPSEEAPEEPSEEAPETPGEQPEEPADETGDGEEPTGEISALGMPGKDGRLPFTEQSYSFTYINPLYADVIDESDIPMPGDTERYRSALRSYVAAKHGLSEETPDPAIHFAESIEEASAEVKAQFVARNEEISVYYAAAADSDWDALFQAIFNGAMVHTGNPREGDYLQYQYGGWGANIDVVDWSEDTYYCCFVYTPAYYTTAAQESAMDGKVGAILGQLSLGGKSDYQKLQAIYDYLCANVVYDYTNLNDDEYMLKYTGYAALVNGTAVCQGISVAFYRLSLTAGVDARIVTSDQMCHAWNIARCQGAYYELDATWNLNETGFPPYWFFLKGSTYWLREHTLGDGYSTLGDQLGDPAFGAYTIPAEDCVPVTSFTVHYDANGGANAPADQVKTQGAALVLSAQVPTRDGYTFRGWALSADAAEPVYLPGDSYTDDADVTLYAVWERTDPSTPEFGTYGPMTYRLLDGEITITGCDESFSGALTIPATINGYPVTAIADRAFEDCDGITSLTLSEGLKCIGDFAFLFCSFENVAIPSSVENIGFRAFGISELTSISVNTANVFFSSIDGVLYNKDQTVLLFCPFGYSGAYTSIPTTVTTISDYAFSNCDSITSVRIPASVKSIGEGAFQDCSELVSISLPEGIPEIRDKTFLGCFKLRNLIIPASVTSIGKEAFESTGLTCISIPCTVQLIDDYAFNACFSLKDIFFEHGKDDPLFFGSLVFVIYSQSTCISTNVYIPDVDPLSINTAISSYDWASSSRNVRFLSASAVPEFGTNLQMEYWLLNDEVTIIACDSSVNGLVAIPSTIAGYPVVAIADHAFDDCTGITDMTLSEGLKRIGDYAFCDCCLSSVEIPASVESIGNRAFGWGITSFFVSKENSFYSSVDGVLFNIDKTVLVCYPSGRSGAYTSMPDTVIAIADYAFFDCDSLTSVYLPDTVKSVGQEAFHCCFDLANISLPEGITEIKYRTFCNCTALKAIIIPTSVTSIGEEAFSYTGLTNIAIPRTVQTIEMFAFGACNSLTDIFFEHGKDDPLTINWGAFESWSGNFTTNVYIPDATNINPAVSNYNWAYYGRDVTFISGQSQTFPATSHLNGGTNNPDNPETYTSLDTVTLADPTREGYAFAGWYDNEAFTGEPVTALAGGVPAAVWAKWEPIAYTVRFDPNGGIGIMASLTDCRTDEPRELPACGFTRTGCAFAGWNTAPGGSGATYQPGDSVVNLCSEPNGVVTLYALWAPCTYYIAFDPNGGDGGDMQPLETLYGQSTVLPAPGFTKTGYTFTGWNTQADGKGTAYADGAAVQNLSSTEGAVVTLYAQWKPNAYTVRFDANGGTGSMAAQAMTYDKAAALKANVFKKASNTFLGWATEPDALAPQYLDKQKVENLTAEPDGEAVLYAVWAKYSYQIVFNPNGGTGDMADDGGLCTYDGSYVLPACTFTRPGFDFLGWATSAKGKVVYQDGQTVSGLSTKNGAVVTLYAVWSAHTYRVVFEPNGGTGTTKAMSCTCGKVVTLTANAFKRAGYSFAGWNTAADGSGEAYANKAKQSNFATENGAVLTLYAQWTPVEYKIAYKNIAAGDHNPNPPTYTVEDAVALEAPARPGCEFLGWFSDAKLTKPVTGIAEGTTGARTFYAKWSGTAYTYGVVFDPNGGTGTMKAMGNLSCGKTYTLTANAFKRAGYSFAGWNTAPDGSGAAYANKAKVGGLSEEDGATVTLYAQWTPVTYKITYKNATVYDGNTNPETFTVEDTVALAPVTRPGCVFEGWFSDAKFKKPVAEIASGHVGNLTLYAKWSGKAATYTIAFNGNGATSGKMASMTKRVCGTGYALTANAFKRTGYSFAGWNTAPDGSGTAYANKEKVANLCTVNGGTATLYAQWAPIVYTITYKNLNQARLPEQTSYTIEDGFELPVPVKAGQVFLGWYSTANFKAGTEVRAIEPGTTGNKTFYAKWMLLANAAQTA